MPTPFITYGLGGKFDQGFNESAAAGVAAFEELTGQTVTQVEIQSASAATTIVLRANAQGFIPLIAVSDIYADAIGDVAQSTPDGSYVLVSAALQAPDDLPTDLLRMVRFDFGEMAYAAGYLAGLATDSGTVGFVGGQLIPEMAALADRYTEGAQAADPNITVEAYYTGTTPSAQNDPVRAGELARIQIAAGADVIFSPSGASAQGVYQAVADQGAQSIGFGGLSYGGFEDSMLSSFYPRADTAVLSALSSEEARAPGDVVLGFAEDGLAFLPDTRAETLLSSDLADALSAEIARAFAEAPETPTLPENLVLDGTTGDDTLIGGEGNDTINGGDGADNLIGNGGDDLIIGGASADDLRDNIFGGAGHDTIRGGYGNDDLRGDAGDDVVSGGFGGDTVIGGTGNDSITGSALGDLLFGSDGDDFINGGFGYDRVNGGAGADGFFHLGIADHGSDWIQDYASADGDTLVFGVGSATANQFQINTTVTEGAGDRGVGEAFVIYRPTGQIMWALIDGAGQDQINLQIGGDVFDLMA